jgi:hypothetical protein
VYVCAVPTGVVLAEETGDVTDAAGVDGIEPEDVAKVIATTIISAITIKIMVGR